MFSRLILQNESEDYVDNILEELSCLLSKLKEKWIVDIIKDYLIEERIIFESPLFRDCIDMKIEENGDIVLIKEIVIPPHMYEDFECEYQQITIQKNGVLTVEDNVEYDHHNCLIKSQDYSTNSHFGNSKLFVNKTESRITFTSEDGIINQTFDDIDNKILIDGHIYLSKVENNKFIIANKQTIFLLDHDNILTTLYNFVTTRQNCYFDKICHYQSHFMVVSQYGGVIVLGDYRDPSRTLFIDFRKDLNVHECSIACKKICSNTFNPRYPLLYLGRFDKKYLLIIDLELKKIKQIETDRAFEAIWCINERSIMLVDCIGTIIQYFN